MPDPVLILAPLLVLAVVLLLGFAGCFTKPERPPEPEPTPTPTLTFRARVPTALTVEPPGVKFVWMRPGATSEETVTVSTSTPEGGDNVFAQAIDSPEPGSWLGRCEMTVREAGQVADATSGNFPFELPAVTQSFVLVFRTEGSPSAPPFRVISEGLT
jgi:hypothetical protein